jgi:hypothetical protein
VVSNIIEKLNKEFGNETPVTQTRGKSHDYLGMIMNYNDDKTVEIDMKSYIENIISEMPEDMIGKAATPAANHLFKINHVNPEKLSKDKAEIFHRITMQLQWLSQRGRPDIRTAVSFLSRRVYQPDNDDYKKLARVMKYLQNTFDLTLRLGSNSNGIVKWWVDVSFATHDNMRSHTGGTLSLGEGCVYSTSGVQKLVTRSSTESELVGVHDVMPQIIWTKNFLEEQGFKISENILHQDNKSTILLAENGRSSSTKRTRHINLQYFFIKDQIDRKEVQLEYCPTEEMLADYFTKPIQGTLFLKL